MEGTALPDADPEALPEGGAPNRVSYFVSDEDTGFLDIARRYLDAVSADNVQKVNIDQF